MGKRHRKDSVKGYILAERMRVTSEALVILGIKELGFKTGRQIRVGFHEHDFMQNMITCTSWIKVPRIVYKRHKAIQSFRVAKAIAEQLENWRND